MRILRFLLVCCFFQSISAKSEIDSLAQRFLEQETVDLKTFDILFNLVQTRYPEELALFGEVLLEKSRVHKNHDGIHRAHDAIGTYLKVKGNHEQAFRLLFRAMRYYERTNNLLYKMKNYYLIGTVYVALGKIDEALYWMERSKELAELNPDPLPLYNVRYDMAVLHFRKSAYRAGLNLIDENKKEFEGLSLIQKSGCYTLYGNYALVSREKDKAKVFYDSALYFARQSEDLVEMSSCMTNLGIYTFEEDAFRAKAYFDSSLVYSKESNLVDAIARDYYNLGFWFLEAGDQAMSKVYFDSSYQVAAAANAIQPMIDATQEIIAIHKEAGNWTEVDKLNQRLIDISQKQYEVLKASLAEYDQFDESYQAWKFDELREDQENRRPFLDLNSTALWIIGMLLLVIIALVLALLRKALVQPNKSRN